MYIKLGVNVGIVMYHCVSKTNVKTYDMFYTTYLSWRRVEWILKSQWRGVTAMVSKRQLDYISNEPDLSNYKGCILQYLLNI